MTVYYPQHQEKKCTTILANVYFFKDVLVVLQKSLIFWIFYYS